MAGLLSAADVTALSGIYVQHFSTFCRVITVHKEPDKIISANSSAVYAGYGPESDEQNVTYSPKNQTFSGIVIWDNEQTTKPLTQDQTVFGAGEVKIKVQKDCRDYINTDRTLAITIDGRDFNLLSYDKTQNYLGLTYYIYKLDNAN